MQDWCSGNIAAFQAVVASSSLVSCSNKSKPLYGRRDVVA